MVTMQSSFYNFLLDKPFFVVVQIGVFLSFGDVVDSEWNSWCCDWGL